MTLHVGIDLGSRALKVVAGSMKGPLFSAERAFTVPVAAGQDPEEAIHAAIATLKESLPKAPGARYSLSGKELIIRYTHVPPVPTWRLRLLMDFEVREMAHQAGEPLASDYNLVSVPGKGDDDETVLVAVVKEKFLESRHAAVSAACGPARAGVPASVALFNSYLHAGALHEGEYVFLVDIGDRNTEIVLQKDGELLFARNIAAGGRLLTDAVAQAFAVSAEDAEALKEAHGNVTPKGMATYTTGKEERVANAVIGPTGQLASMLQSSLAFCRAQTGIKDLKIGRILLSGGGANLRGLGDYLASSFGCPVERFQPENGLELAGLGAEEAAEFEADPGRFAVALGLAVMGAKPEAFLVDITPSAVKKKRAFATRTIFTILSGVAALLFLGFHAFDLASTRGKLEVEERSAKLRAKSATRDSGEYVKTLDRLRDLNLKQRLLDERTTGNWALATVPRVVKEACPDGTWISQVDVRPAVVEVEGDGKQKIQALRTVVDVEGRILSLEREASAAATDISSTIERERKDWQVTIRKQSATAGGSKKMDIGLRIEPWPLGPPPAAAEEGGR